MKRSWVQISPDLRNEKDLMKTTPKSLKLKGTEVLSEIGIIIAFKAIEGGSIPPEPERWNIFEYGT